MVSGFCSVWSKWMLRVLGTVRSVSSATLGWTFSWGKKWIWREKGATFLVWDLTLVSDKSVCPVKQWVTWSWIVSKRCSLGSLDRLGQFRNFDLSSGVLWAAVDPNKPFHLIFAENSENLQSSHCRRIKHNSKGYWHSWIIILVHVFAQ